MSNERHGAGICEVCGNTSLHPVLDLGSHPMCDDLVAINEQRTCVEYPIEILFCKTCFTAHQRFQVPKRDLFPQTYHYRSRFTSDVLNGMRELVDACGKRVGGLTQLKVLDIGCNDGSLLNFFRDKGAVTFGIEPTGACQDAVQQGHTVFNDFLSPDVAQRFVSQHGQPDVISFTNVFAHIENLAEVVQSLRILMAPKTLLIIENHYLGSVLKTNQFDTFYHEHPRTYSFTSFVHIAESLGARLIAVEFPSRYGGNIRVMIGGMDWADRGSVPDPELKRIEQGFFDAFADLRRRVEDWRLAKRAFIDGHVARFGKLRAKAFPGRAAILIKLLGLGTESISAVYEKPGSMKIGHFLPGTRIPIRSDDELFALADQEQPLLNLAWHIPAEIRTYLGQHGYGGPIVDILSQKDFAG